MPGPENTYQSYGTAWANLSNTPFRLYKHWIHEGGISTPLIVHWPDGIREQGRGAPHAGLPARHHGDDPRRDGHAPIRRSATARPSMPLEGHALAPAFERDGLERPPMFWEHEGNAAVRIGRWKLVRKYPGRGSSTTWSPTAPS